MEEAGGGGGQSYPLEKGRNERQKTRKGKEEKGRVIVLMNRESRKGKSKESQEKVERRGKE